MTTPLAAGEQALDALYWRAEILQAMFWMRGEGLETDVEPSRLADFLAVDRATLQSQMSDLAMENFLRVVSSNPLRYALTESGIAEGGRSFQDEFAALTHAAHYACAPGCWCHDPDHAGEPCPSTPGSPPNVPDPRPAEDRRAP